MDEKARVQGEGRGTWPVNCKVIGAARKSAETAMMALCFEVYFRYGRVVGVR